jgi:hypothetical protein
VIFATGPDRIAAEGWFSGWRPLFEVAEREGFEPSEEFPLHMISSHADSAWLSHLSDAVRTLNYHARVSGMRTLIV